MIRRIWEWEGDDLWDSRSQKRGMLANSYLFRVDQLLMGTVKSSHGSERSSEGVASDLQRRKVSSMFHDLAMTSLSLTL